MQMKIGWTEFKQAVPDLQLQVKFLELDDRILIWGIDEPVVVHCSIPKPGSDYDDFDGNFRAIWNGRVSLNVVTASEIDNKNLRTMCGFSTTDVNGRAEVVIPIPQPGRWVAFGDSEFDIRHMGDYVATMEVDDINRLVAWQIALQIDPSATAPVPDAVVQAAGYPIYPIMGHFDERGINQSDPNIVGDIKGGMSMTFQYGTTEAQPVGGYAFIPGGMYFRIIAKKAAGHTTGFKLAVSIDWAEPK